MFVKQAGRYEPRYTIFWLAGSSWLMHNYDHAYQSGYVFKFTSTHSAWLSAFSEDKPIISIVSWFPAFIWLGFVEEKNVDSDSLWLLPYELCILSIRLSNKHLEMYWHNPPSASQTPVKACMLTRICASVYIKTCASSFLSDALRAHHRLDQGEEGG